MTLKLPIIDPTDRADGRILVWDNAAGVHVYEDPAAGSTPTIELAYAEITSNASITATSEATANTVVSAGAVVFDGSTPVVIEFQASRARPNATAASVLEFWLYDGSSSIGRIGYLQAQSTTPLVPIRLSHRLTPSAASHTYSIRAHVNAGTGLVVAGAGGAGTDMPAFIRIVKALP